MTEKRRGWHYKKYQREQTPVDRVRYADAEVEARLRRKGLWRDAEPIPPWEWRKARR
jgi:endonuclease YncB( thermonuclease family)